MLSFLKLTKFFLMKLTTESCLSLLRLNVQYKNDKNRMKYVNIFELDEDTFIPLGTTVQDIKQVCKKFPTRHIILL